MSRVATLFTEPAFGKPFVGLLAESQHDPVLADALHQWLITARRAGAAEVLRRGVERGELRADLDVDIAIDALYGGSTTGCWSATSHCRRSTRAPLWTRSSSDCGHPRANGRCLRVGNLEPSTQLQVTSR